MSLRCLDAPALHQSVQSRCKLSSVGVTARVTCVSTAAYCKDTQELQQGGLFGGSLQQLGACLHTWAYAVTFLTMLCEVVVLSKSVTNRSIYKYLVLESNT